MSENLKQVDSAKEVLRVLEEHGEDMADVRHVIHYFYGGNVEALGAALRELGYGTEPTAGDDGIVADREEAIGEEWRTTTLRHLCELADTYGAEYEGWEASMERQPEGAGEDEEE
ncbi:MAG TPA: ribonuclease E inhibitor RraB [Allosphingosinicella sp.]|nr:ribonuclease E inhibitor RraB [Allosphingosinicella sp.]